MLLSRKRVFLSAESASKANCLHQCCAFRRNESCAKRTVDEFASGPTPTFARRSYISASRSKTRRVHILSQLFCRTARTPLQSSLQEVRFLFKLFGFLLKKRT